MADNATPATPSLGDTLLGLLNKGVDTAAAYGAAKLQADATVKAHVRAILAKFGACARTEAVAIAARRGLAGALPYVVPAQTH